MHYFSEGADIAGGLCTRILVGQPERVHNTGRGCYKKYRSKLKSLEYMDIELQVNAGVVCCIASILRNACLDFLGMSFPGQ